MKRITLLASGALIISLIAIAVGGSFLMVSSTATRPSKTYDDYMADGDLYLENSEYYKAIVSYENALSEKENSMDALQGLASTYYRQMNREKEAEIRNQIAEKNPSDLDNQVRLVELMINEGNLDEAKEKMQELMASNDSDSLRSLYSEMEIATPVFNLSSGSYAEYQLLQLTNAYNNAIVRYTTDGSEPNTSSQAYIDGIVISYPETVIRVKAFGSLGYTSDEITLNFSITKPVEIVYSRNGYGGNYSNTLYRISNSVLNKSWNSDVYNYEMAQIRELYMLGDYNVDTEPMSATFYGDYYKRYDSRYTEHGNFDLTFTAYTPFLKTLSVGYQTNLDLSPLASLSYIEDLSLLNNGITNISPLSGLTSLRRLALGWNNISDVSALSNLTELESLGLWNNQIANIDALRSLSNLTYLDVAYNNISNLGVVSGMPELNELWINNNQIADISPVADNQKLMVLMQCDNPISNYDALTDIRPQLYKTDLEG